MIDTGKKFWLSNKAKNVFNSNDIEQVTIQPLIAELINAINPQTLLDYGCGDSFISNLVSKDISWGLYDLNYETAQAAYATVRTERLCDLYKSPEDIPEDYFDCILFSLVLVCIDTHEEYVSILRNFMKFKKKSGKLILVTTHPCFRQYEFRAYYTSYLCKKSFNYLADLDPFIVYLKQENDAPVDFVDYHWTLGSTINGLIELGFAISKVIEVPDIKLDEMGVNMQFPPFLILICE